MARKPFPLQWPPWTPRTTGYRETPLFESRFAKDRDSIIRQLEMMRATNIVITSDLPTRDDGLPYANSRCQDPGIAVWWTQTKLRGPSQERVIACDRWCTVGYNLRAVEMTLKALRGISRWGTTSIVDQAFSGFAQPMLPAPASLGRGRDGDPRRPLDEDQRVWTDVLGITAIDEHALGDEALLELAKEKHRELIKIAHPDAGGSTQAAALLNEALSEARGELTRAAIIRG